MFSIIPGSAYTFPGSATAFIALPWPCIVDPVSSLFLALYYRFSWPRIVTFPGPISLLFLDLCCRFSCPRMVWACIVAFPGPVHLCIVDFSGSESSFFLPGPIWLCIAAFPRSVSLLLLAPYHPRLFACPGPLWAPYPRRFSWPLVIALDSDT